MADFDTQIRESQAQVEAAQGKIAELTGRIETARTKMASGTDITLDIENATLTDVHQHTELMNANIAELIMGLDDVTEGFSKDFQEMRSKTGWESVVGVFSAGRSEAMRQEQVQLAKSQTLERYIEKGKTWIDSLQNQAATQMVLINKLQTDTRQRVVLYDALSKSLKTAQQQDVAHRINEIGVRTDREAQTAMAGIGAATNARMADMLESHEDNMVFARDVLEAKAKADERFMRRFAAIVEKHDKNLYGENAKV